MLTKRIETELNKQINAEMFSSYLYLSMAAHFESLSLKGFANWMRIQAKEENAHAMKFYNYVCERGGKVTLNTIDAPKTSWNSILEVFEEVVTHEYKISSLINNLVNVAAEEKDHSTNNMLQWFVAEQVEEEANAEELVAQIKLIGDNGYGILMLDRELATRVFVDPLANPQQA